MAKSNVFMNWKSVTVGGTALTQVTDVQTVTSETLEPWQADGHLFATLLVRAGAMRGVTIHSGDVAGMLAVARGTPLTVVAILADAANQLGAGALSHTWTNAVVADIPASGPSNKFAGGSITLLCYAPDGATDPLTVAQA